MADVLGTPETHNKATLGTREIRFKSPTSNTSPYNLAILPIRNNRSIL
jgi:hypothetical protein